MANAGNSASASEKSGSVNGERREPLLTLQGDRTCYHQAFLKFIPLI